MLTELRRQALQAQGTWSRSLAISSPSLNNCGTCPGRLDFARYYGRMDPATIVDLKAVSPAHLTGALLKWLRDLRPGSSIRIRVGEDPEWALRSVDLHLQHRLDWRCTHAADGSWTVTVHCAEGAAADDLITLLLRDHRRLDALVAHALAMLNRGAAAAGNAAVAECAAAIRVHLRLEDELLLPTLQPMLPASEHAASAVHVEHTEILQHLAAVEQTLAESAGDISEAAILCAMLSGLMAKHEHREEATLFPYWQGALARSSEADRRTLTQRARQRLVG